MEKKPARNAQGSSEWVSTKYSAKQTLPGIPRESFEWFFTTVYGFPCFGPKALSNPRDDKAKKDAMVKTIHWNGPSLRIY